MLIGRRFAAALLPRLFGTNPRSHHKGATGRFELETNGFQFYAIANLDKTSLNNTVHSLNCVFITARPLQGSTKSARETKLVTTGF